MRNFNTLATQSALSKVHFSRVLVVLHLASGAEDNATSCLVDKIRTFTKP